VSGQRHAPAALYSRERPGTHCAGGWFGPQGRSGRAENFAPTGIRSQDRPARSQSLYGLSYRAHILLLLLVVVVVVVVVVMFIEI
jgi:hypothetical protein